MSSVLLLSALFVLAPFCSGARGQRAISVNPSTGNDTLCRSNSSEPCQSLQGALESNQMLKDTVISFSNGTHHLNETVKVVDGDNITLEAAMALEAVVRCIGPNGSIAIVNSTNVIFRGIILENCGPESAGILVNISGDISVEDCVFRLDCSHYLHVLL